MIYETRKYIDILTKLKITPNQFLFCWLLYNKQWDELKDYLQGFGKFTIEEINDLVDKDIILKMSPTKKRDVVPADLHVTEIFAHEMIVTDDDAWDELWSTYPSKLVINGTQFASKGIKLEEEKELRLRYLKYIKKNKYEHVKIIALIQNWASKNKGFATMKIDKFIISEHWKDLEMERETYVAPTIF